MCPSHESDISTDKRAGVWLGLSVPSLVMVTLFTLQTDILTDETNRQTDRTHTRLRYHLAVEKGR